MQIKLQAYRESDKESNESKFNLKALRENQQVGYMTSFRSGFVVTILELSRPFQLSLTAFFTCETSEKYKRVERNLPLSF